MAKLINLKTVIKAAIKVVDVAKAESDQWCFLLFQNDYDSQQKTLSHLFARPCVEWSKNEKS